MASVFLEFVPPAEPNLARLLIYEAATKEGSFAQIEAVTAIGTAPNYITEHITEYATNPAHWFAIQWEAADGLRTAMSQAIQGGTNSLVQKVMLRVRDRDSSLSERVVVQEAEAAIQQVFGSNADPYDPALVQSASYRQLQGLVYLTMARAYIVNAMISAAAGNVQSATMGLVSFKSGTTSHAVQKDVQPLIDMANKELGISTSYVMVMEDVDLATYITYDHSRLVSGWLSIE